MRVVQSTQMHIGEVEISRIVLDPKSRDDIPQILRGLSTCGRIGLTGLLKLLTRVSAGGQWIEVVDVRDQGEVSATGTPHVGLPPHLRGCEEKEKYHYLELGWTLEDNESINSLIEEAGAKTCKRYRIFRKSL